MTADGQKIDKAFADEVKYRSTLQIKTHYEEALWHR